MAAAASFPKPLPALLSLLLICLISSSAHALSSCSGPCSNLNDCRGQLICTGGGCTEYSNVVTHICSGGRSLPTDDGCKSTGSMTCQGQTYDTYTCTPPVASTASATLTLNNFSQCGDEGGPSECDGSYHDNNEAVVAVSTGWYASGSLCGRMIRITTSDGRSTTAKVVDECNSKNGCDAEHALQGPCRNNIVDGSAAVWNTLGLNMDVGVVPVTWSMV